MRHVIYTRRDGARSQPFNEVEREEEAPATLSPPKDSPLPWRLESGFGWGGDTALVAANHDNEKGVEGSSVVLNTRNVTLKELHYIATAGNYFPRAIVLLRLQLEHTGHSDGDCERCIATRAFLRELGVVT